jgi:hypothetical protein
MTDENLFAVANLVSEVTECKALLQVSSSKGVSKIAKFCFDVGLQTREHLNVKMKIQLTASLLNLSAHQFIMQVFN